MKNWFVLNTKPKKEHHVEKIFTEAGFEIYNPKYSHDGRIKPFFSGYDSAIAAVATGTKIAVEKP